MLTPTEKEILQRVYERVPQFQAFLENRISRELHDLPHANADKVQILQGRCLALQALLADLEGAAGISADRTAKP